MPNAAALTELCPGCFADKGSASLCPHCGYDESLKRGPLVLAHRTLLHNGQYLIGRVLGKPGGFGITYLALDTKLETRVAIKEYLPRDLAGRDAGHATISAHSAEDGEFFRYGLTQFLQEARTLAQFDHANIVRVRNFFEENGTGYLVMDYYDGVTLADYLAQQPQGRLPEKIAVGILMPILDGLREVHAKHFLHRDIKPQNIYLTTGNRPILLDFGAARQTMGERSRSLSVVLSEGYAPYEQYHRRGEQGPWTDIYACAAVLYHAVAGEAPPPATERVHKDELDIAALGVSASLANALWLGLAADHHSRPQRMTEFQALLLGGGEAGAVEAGEQRHVPASENLDIPRPADPTQSKGQRSPKVWWSSALVVAVIAVVAAIGVGTERKTVPNADVAAPSAVSPAPTIATPAPTTVRDDPETNLWNEAKASGERKRLDAYIEQYPKGQFVDLAEIELKKLDEREAVARNSAEAEKQQAADQVKAEQSRAEQQAWNQAKADNTPDAYAAYLKNYPKGRFAALAMAAQQKVQREAVEREQQAAAEALRREQEAKYAASEAIRLEQEAKYAASEAIRLEQEAKKVASEAARREQENRESTAIAKICSSIDQIATLSRFQKKEEIKQKSGELVAWIRSDDAAALGWIRKAANGGNAEAQSCFGVMYIEALGVTKNDTEGVRWIRKAVAQENARAQLVLGVAYFRGSMGVTKDVSEAKRLLRKAAEHGNALAGAVLEKIGDN